MSRTSSSSPSPEHHAFDYNRVASASPTMQHTPPSRFHGLPGGDDTSPVDPPSPAKSTTSSLSAEAAPFAPAPVTATPERNATADYLTHLAKEAEARSAAHAQRTAEQDKAAGIGIAAATVLQVSDLHWFTSDAHLLEAAKGVGLTLTFKDVTFLEHKCNGKSKGIAFINCHSTQNMIRLMKWFETHEFQGKKVSTSVSTNLNGKPNLPPPTHDKDNGGLGFRPNNEEAPTRAPLPFLPTNSHGGVNFNRVPLHHRQQMQQMQQAGFLNGGSYGRAKGMQAYTAAQNGSVGYAADVARKKVMAQQPNPFYIGDWQDQVNAQPIIRTMRV